MIASPISPQMDSARPRAELPPFQKQVLALAAPAGIHQLAEYLGDVYEILPATTETQLIATLQHQPVQLIVIDAAPPKTLEGLSLCSRLKSSLRFAHLPVILVTARNYPPDQVSGLEAGADACIETPLSRDHLRALIRNLFANRLRLEDHLRQTAPPHHNQPSGPNADTEFLHRLNRFITENMPDTGLDVHSLARGMNISRPTLYRKIRSISRLTPNELINTVRLRKAAELLSAGNNKVYEIAKMVGFNSRSNFGKAFMKQFGVTPREFQQKGHT